MLRQFPALIGLLVAASCSSGSRTASVVPGTGGDFFVFATDPVPQAQIFLNDSVFVTFTGDVDLGTANLNSVSFAVFDLNGNALQEQPRGTFAVGASVGGEAGNTRVLEFRPSFPTNDDYSNGGFKSGRRYLMQIAQGNVRQGVTLRDKTGRGLRDAFTLAFQTVAGDTPSQLFRDLQGGGPRVTGIDVVPTLDGVAYLGKKNERPVEVRVKFDQPLNPASTNLPTRLDPNPAIVDPRLITALQKGRIFLEYDDPEYGAAAWIPAVVDIDSNSNAGSSLLLTVAGVLPNNANVRVIVEPTLEDLSGESNRNNPDHVRAAFTFRTEGAREPQFDAIVESFDNLDQVDLAPTFLEPLAEIGSGYVRAGFEFEGTETQFDYVPRVREIQLNTDFTQITPANGSPFNVSGGVFQFRNVTIPENVTVIGTGSKPMVWLVTGDFVVEGEIRVAGGPGARVDTLMSPNFPTPGGNAGCGGGNGGRGSPATNDSDIRGENGFGAFQTPSGGGAGGRHSCDVASCARGGGGGGGSFTSQGDPHYALVWLGTPPGLPSVGLGKGGRMCTQSPPTGPQADAGPLAFIDLRRDNDFWGSLVDQFIDKRITGEILSPRGGTGGGGGGDTGTRCPPNPGFLTDTKGGGGGAGGGVLIVKALGRIVVKSRGLINANGGDGGGGEQAGTNGAAGGGGAGSGGMIVLMSGSGIHIVRHGGANFDIGAYADGNLSGNTNGSYTFAVQADGGIGLRGPFQGNAISGKYPGLGGPSSNAAWDFNPLGGFGGLGLIQLMVPPGPSAGANVDGTATRLDDNIFFYNDDVKLDAGLASATNPHAPGGPAMTGIVKQKFIGWRGVLDEQGVGHDDSGNPVTLPFSNHGEGDIRPSPILLPAPFGATSRLRSRWIDTGATARLPDPTGTDQAPRKMVERIDQGDPTNPFTSLTAGPTYLFSGAFHEAGRPLGYVRYDATGASREIPVVLPTPAPVAAVEANAQWRGQPAYVVRLRGESALLGQVPGRYTGYRAQLRNNLGSVIGAYRILGHTGTEIHLSPDDGFLPEEPTAAVQLIADLVGFRNTDGEGFGATYVENGVNVPFINARIGFAFHVNPKEGLPGTNRYPSDPTLFAHNLDLQRPEVMRQIRALGKLNNGTKGAVSVQYDILFNMAYSERSGSHVDSARRLSPNTPRPEVRYLVLPFQF